MGDTNLSDYTMMDLPAEIREKLAELDLELSEDRNSAKFIPISESREEIAPVAYFMMKKNFDINVWSWYFTLKSRMKPVFDD
uniref:CSON006150 protein n=1 Tax=Culicoides sonorensis TaxID=179676 RepID=A0A336LVZ0_CULSO